MYCNANRSHIRFAPNSFKYLTFLLLDPRMGSFQKASTTWIGSQQTLSSADSIDEALGVTHYSAEYQPIVGLNSQQVFAYEALARFYNVNQAPVSPISVFQALHSNSKLLGRAELQLKWLQIAAAPANTHLFINLDPHALTEEVRSSMLELLTPDKRLVVELIENSDLQDSHASMMLLESLHEQGISSALDDIGASESMLSIDLMVAVDYMKFDRRWVALLDEPDYERLFRHLLTFARASGRKTVLEGVETEAQLMRLQDYPLDFVQGFLYRTQFLSSPRFELELGWDH